jgi:hypothetical protein
MLPNDKDLERVRRLIDEATAKVGTQGKLASTLRYSRQEVSEWKLGKRSCPVQAQALMADIAGLSAEEVALFVVIEQERNPERKARLLEVLGKGLQRTSAALLAVICGSFVWAFDPPPAMAGALHDVYYVKCDVRMPDRRIHLTTRYQLVDSICGFPSTSTRK